MKLYLVHQEFSNFTFNALQTTSLHPDFNLVVFETLKNLELDAHLVALQDFFDSMESDAIIVTSRAVVKDLSGAKEWVANTPGDIKIVGSFPDFDGEYALGYSVTRMGAIQLINVANRTKDKVVAIDHLIDVTLRLTKSKKHIPDIPTQYLTMAVPNYYVKTLTDRWEAIRNIFSQSIL